jgi:hypothetical protein
MSLAAVLALAACKKQEEARRADDAPSPEAKADPAGEAEGGSGKSGKGLAKTFELALRGSGRTAGLELIPEAATVVGGVDVAVLVKLPIWATLRPSLPPREDGLLAAGERCGVGPGTWRSFVIGTEPQSRQMAMVVSATGLGKPETLRCLALDIGFSLSEDAKRMSDHTGGGVVIDDDSIAFATTGWMDRLAARIDGHGKGVAEGPLEACLARTDRTKTLWFAGVLPEDAGAMAKMALDATVHDVAGWADLAAGLKIEVSLAVHDGKAVRERLQQQWEAAKSLATSSGLPRGIADSLEITDKNDLVRVQASATELEVRIVTDTVMQAMGIRTGL